MYDSSAPYFIRSEDLIVINVPEKSTDSSLLTTITNTITDQIAQDNQTSQAVTKTTSMLTGSVQNPRIFSSPNAPRLKRPRLASPLNNRQKERDGLLNLKKDNLIKASRLLDLQIEVAEQELELKKVSATLEKYKLEMFKKQHDLP